ncbi:MAG: hypothetical protein K2N72_12530 [Oscillospiraceae bacterium]|nr:hypothetical protein [Oscillospiraceae bacterium]
MESNIKTVLIILTYIPYALVLLSGLYGAIFGAKFIINEYHGLGGFLLGALVSLSAMLYIPVIPMCIVFHLLCQLRRKVPFISNMNTNAFDAICAAVCLAVFIALFIRTHSHKFEKMRQKANAKHMSARADEKIAFNKSTILCDGIFDLHEYKSNHILIDYDKNDVGFLIHSCDDRYYEIHLAETSPDSPEYRHIADTYFVQSDIPLSSPGKRLVSFSDERYRQYTVALLLFYEDGTIFYADGIRSKDNKDIGQYFGLDHPRELIRLEDSEKI